MEAYQKLEEAYGRWIGWPATHMVACASGTAALHLALEALQLPQGAEVILSDYNMIACARAVSLADHSPVFIDCTQDLLLCPDALDATITDPARVVLASHIYGRRCDMEAISTLCRKYDLLLLEDLAEAHGVPVHPQTDAACWSFYKNKIIGGEEGGMVAFKNVAQAALARQLRNLGFTPEHNFQHLPRGHNYRLANCLARKVLASLRQYPVNVEVRRQAENNYNTYCPAAWRMPLRNAPWVYDLRIPGMDSSRQQEVVRALNKVGIAARCGFKSLHQQAEYRTALPALPGATSTKNSRHNPSASLYRNSLRLANEVLYLPLTPGWVDQHSARQAFTIIQQLVGSPVPATGVTPVA